jgi:hypothetical protein
MESQYKNLRDSRAFHRELNGVAERQNSSVMCSLAISPNVSTVRLYYSGKVRRVICGTNYWNRGQSPYLPDSWQNSKHFTFTANTELGVAVSGMRKQVQLSRDERQSLLTLDTEQISERAYHVGTSQSTSSHRGVGVSYDPAYFPCNSVNVMAG